MVVMGVGRYGVLLEQTPKSGMDDMRVFETDAVLSVLKPNVVMLGLNLS